MSVLKNTIGFGHTVTVAALALGLMFVGFSASAQGLGDFIRRNVLGNVPYGDEIAAVGQAAQALGMTSQQADSVGQSVALSVAAQHNGLHPDQALNDYVNLVGMTVVNASPWADRPIHFAVLNSTAVNAYSAPNGYVLITYGALQLMEDEAELAGVLAHEVGHVVYEHGLAAVRRANLFEAGLSLANSNDDAAQLGQASDFLVRFVTTQGFDQPAEVEADYAAIQYVSRAGYDPEGFARFLQRLADGQGGGGLFSTHPATGERVARTRLDIAALDDRGAGQRIEARYAFYLGRGGVFVPVIEESADAPETIEDADELQIDENILPPVAVDDAEQHQVDDNIPPPVAVEDAEEPLSVEVTEAPVPIESADTPVAVEDSDQPQISDAPPAAQAVQDLVAPAVVVPADITMDTEPGQNYATVQYSQPTARDNVGVVSDPVLIAGLSSGNAFPVGTMTVTYQASDSAGNIGAASFNVTIRDVEAPVVTLPADITLNAASDQDYAVVSYGEPIATDNVGVALGPTLVAGLYSGSQFPVGTTSVTYEASDASGNTGIGSFVVTVERAVQNQAPTRPFISRF